MNTNAQVFISIVVVILGLVTAGIIGAGMLNAKESYYDPKKCVRFHGQWVEDWHGNIYCKNPKEKIIEG